MKVKKIVFFSGALGIAALALAASSADAQTYRSGSGNRMGFGRQSAANYQSIEQACANSDYSAWKELMGNRRITQYVTADNFGKYCEMRELRHSGKTAEADQLRSDLGLTWQRGGGRHGNCQR